MTRVLVTGSREVKPEDRPAVAEALAEAVRDSRGPHTLVHGGASGADSLAGEIAAGWGWTVEVHRADWTAPCEPSCNHGPRRQRQGYDADYCPAAGHRRNARMVGTKPAVVVAIYKRGAANKGTANCVRLAKGAGLYVRRVVV